MEDRQSGHPADRQVADDVVRRAQEGDQAAFGELYETYYDRIYRYVSFKCGSRSEAEDLTGDVFLKMLESVHSYRFQGYPFTSWLYRIAHNVVVDNFRRKGRRPTTPLENALHVADPAEGEMEKRAQISWTMGEVVEAMDDLTELQREAITLRFAAGLSIAETASAMDRKENAVKALQHAGIRKLRRALIKPEPLPTAGRIRGQVVRGER